MKISLILFILGNIVLIACNSSSTKNCKAKIIERKALNDSMIQLRYAYKISENTFEDSIQTKNIIINTDSITVHFSSQNPKIHTVDLP